jgi:hypothetical protein
MDADGTMFIGLQRYQQKYESPFKLCFGPKSFLVISDPVQARHLLRDANTNYDKVWKNYTAELQFPFSMSPRKNLTRHLVLYHLL